MKTALSKYREASALQQRGWADAAGVLFSEVLEETQEQALYAGAWFHMGELYWDAGKKVQARDAFGKCLQYCPCHRKARAYVGLLQGEGYVSETQDTRRFHHPANDIMPESVLAHRLLDGLSGIEIGAAAHNPFGLTTINVGLSDVRYDDEQFKRAGRVCPIDIEAPADAVPLPDESTAFVIASHVLEHCPDFIGTVREWFRLIKPGGFLFIIFPKPDTSPADRGRPLSTWDELLVLHETGTAPEAPRELHRHYHVLDLARMKDMMRRIFGAHMHLCAEQETDDKVGNGFTVVYQKTDASAQ